ncbi:TSUP family transporter [Streptomyces sp. 3MP-14]|uniref:Probable membrane transporter protein n=1 Tax=Streptomyces mimosae TaxID=2586635 RepID=A0A5N6A289_9ACTN|nr:MULTISPECIES: sulfite exporter TauE/SafE family protein [Streptomyces]KAB8162887.1 TSUP family transporter [Streptomyces mimosae]KAB8179100.1 TSUP family transporter [Streptomyces sp. 3MP-14]
MTVELALSDALVTGGKGAAILAAGFWAGMINVVVGSGTLVSFPVLVLCGYSPLVANISNNIGLVGGGLSGTIGYRRELRENADLARVLLPASLVGGIAGALLLLVLPDEAFGTVVPALIAVGLLMVVAGPFVQRAAARRASAEPAEADRPAPPARRLGLLSGIAVVGVYGGYFGAAQGILVVGLLSILTAESLQSVNAVKNLLVTGVNLVATLVFMTVAWGSIDWPVVALLAVGATLGGVVGARVGRRLPPRLLRTLIVVIGTVAIVNLVFF